MTLAVIPLAKRRPMGTPLTWGEAMVASVYVFFVHVPRVRRRAPPVADPRRRRAELARRRAWWSDRRSAPAPARVPARSTSPARCSATSSPSGIYVVFFGAADLRVGLVAEARARRRPAAEQLHSAYGRPLVKGLTPWHDRCQPADAGLVRPVPARRGRRRLPGQGGQAEAVHPHRSVRVHHVRGLRRHLPVEVHPHGHPGCGGRGGQHRAAGRRPERQRHLPDRRRRLHPLRPVRRPVPDRRDHPRARPARRPRVATPTRAPTTTGTRTGCGSEESVMARHDG